MKTAQFHMTGLLESLDRAVQHELGLVEGWQDYFVAEDADNAEVDEAVLSLVKKVKPQPASAVRGTPSSLVKTPPAASMKPAAPAPKKPFFMGRGAAVH